MLWQNASATTLAIAMPYSSRCHASRRSARTVVAPSRRRQNAAKSCSPSRSAAAVFIASMSSGSGGKYQTVRRRSTGSASAGSSHTRYEYRRHSAENRASNPGGAGSARNTRTSAGSTPLSRYASDSTQWPAWIVTCAT